MYKNQIIVFKKYIPLLANLVGRDLKVKYRRSVLGILWSVLNPLLMALVINAVFSHLFRFQIEYFIIYYLTGNVVFSFMNECTTSSMTSIMGAAGLIKKVYMPKYIFIMEKCVFAFINMLFSLAAVAIIALIVKMPIAPTVLLFPIPLIYAAVFSLGLGLILAAVTVFFRDIEHLYGVFVTAWIYLTPIIYPEEILNDFMKTLLKFNPMYYYVTYFRDVVMYGEIPNAAFNGICAAYSLAFLAVGMIVFKKCQDKFILYL